MQLSSRQHSIVTALRECAAEGYAPTLAELCARLGLRSRGSLHKHIKALVAMGLVEPPDGSRGLRLTPAAREDTNTLPVLGRIAAGRPIEAIDPGERIGVPPALRTAGQCYVLAVRGDSMIEEGILDGDWVVVEHRETARDFELVVALIDGHEATLKRFERRGNQVWLHAANPDFPVQTYPAERVAIQGVVVGQMRRYGLS